MNTPKLDNTQKELFAELLAQKYGQRCKTDDKQPSIIDLVRYMIAKGVVSDINIKEFLFFQRYADTLAELGGKTKAVEFLCSELDISKKHGFYLLRSAKFKQMR
jgi:hypothetical protein